MLASLQLDELDVGGGLTLTLQLQYLSVYSSLRTI